MMSWLAFHWHRFNEWRHQLRSARHFALGRLHHDRSKAHGSEADRIRPPRVEAPPPEWDRRRWARQPEHDPTTRQP